MRILALLLLSGCAIRPDTLRLVAEHDSHASQHFGAGATNYGAEALGVELHWQRGHWFADVSELYNVSPVACWGLCYGEIIGPREMFRARTGIEVNLN